MSAVAAAGDGPADDLPAGLRGSAIAFLAGAGVLALEITGARIFTPWFGSSVLVWSNVIGVTLAALAVGNFVGGRLAEARPRRAVLALLLAGAGIASAAVPYTVPLLARRYLPDGLGLDAAFAIIGRASLAVALAALGPPLVLLGAASPFLVRGAARAGRVGRAAGNISAAATLGSLVGTWLPVYVLVPEFGSRWTCVLAGGAALAAAALALGRPRRAVPSAAAAVALAAFVPFAALADRAVGREAAGTVLAELETRYQYARVVETVEGGAKLRVLQLNEGLDSFHSVTFLGQVLTGGRYYDSYPLYLPLARRADGPTSIAVLGFAAGTIARQLLQLYGAESDLRITGVEIDPAVAALGARFFELPLDPRVRLIADQDARVFLDHGAERYDLLVCDVYAQQVYVPFQTCSREFFEAARERLRDGGILVANVNGYALDDAPLAAIRNTAAAVFGEVSLLHVAGARNYVLAAARGGPAPDPRAARDALPAALAEPAAAAGAIGAFRRFAYDPAARVLTDDRAPIEQIADQDLLEKARRQLTEVPP